MKLMAFLLALSLLLLCSCADTEKNSSSKPLSSSIASSFANSSESPTGSSSSEEIQLVHHTYDSVSYTHLIHSENVDDSSFGYLYIADGDFTIQSQLDGLDSKCILKIAGVEISLIASDDGLNAAGAVSYTHLDVYKRQGNTR